MTYHRIKGQHVFECDDCGETFESDAKDFSDAVAELKAKGWRFYAEERGWSHRCDGCL